METTWLTIAQWMLRAGVGGGAILALTLLAMRRVKQPARRQRLGEAGLLAALALAVLALWPAWIPIHYGAAETPRVDFDFAVLAGTLPGAQAAGAQAAERGPLAPAALRQALQRLPEAPLATPRPWPDGLQPALLALVALYTGGAAIFLTRWLLGLVGLRRLIRASTSADPPLLIEFAAHVPTRRLPRLLVSRRVRAPISCGIRRPTVILPASLAIAGEGERRAWVFAHELTHLERRDAWSCVLFALGQVLFFPVPWFWRVQRDVRLCQEFVADAAAVNAAAVSQRPPDEYAAFLLTFTTAPVVPRVATGVSGSTSDLYRRVTMLLENPLRVERRCPAWWTAGAAGALVGLAVFGAGVGLAQAPPNQREVLEQLDRIQDMVNKLRRQVADSQPGPAATVDNVRRAETQKRDAKQEAAKSGAVVRLQAAQALANRSLADLQKAAADSAKAAQDRQVLDAWIRGRVEETAKKPEAERAELIRRLFLDLRGTVPTVDELKKYLATPRDRLILMLKDEAAQAKPAPERNRAAWIDFVRAPQESELKQALELLKAYRDQLEKQPPASKEEVQKRLEEVIDRLNQALQPRGGASFLLVDSASNTARVLGEKIGASTPRGRLGIRLEQPSDILREQLNLPSERGLVVVEVFDGSVAKKAGLQVNDILLKIADQEIESDPEKVAQAVAAIKPETKFAVVVLRRGKAATIPGVQLPPAPQGAVVRFTANRPQITVTLQRMDDGALVARRQDGSIQFTVEASLRDGKAQVRKIAIAEGGNTREFTRVDDVPAEHRGKVEQLVQIIGSLSSSSVPLDRPLGVRLQVSGDALYLLEDKLLLAEPVQPNVIRLESNVTSPPRRSIDLDIVIPKQDRK
jgi:hypothetical protein